MIYSRKTAALTWVNSRAEASQVVFERIAGGPLPRWSEFAPNIQSTRVETGGSVFVQGAAHPFAYVVRRGLIKNVYIRENGEAWIKSFSDEGEFFASISALEQGGRASFSATAVEESELERIRFDELERFAEKDLVWANMLRRATMIFASRKEKRERELLTASPEERYRRFANQYPDLERRLAQKDIAAYLGVTPVGLSRIVRRVRQKNA